MKPLLLFCLLVSDCCKIKKITTVIPYCFSHCCFGCLPCNTSVCFIKLPVQNNMISSLFCLEWRWYPHQNKQDVLYHHKIISFFGDSQTDECPLSVHSLARIGEKLGKKPGDWYGPASVAYVLRWVTFDFCYTYKKLDTLNSLQLQVQSITCILIIRAFCFHFL